MVRGILYVANKLVCALLSSVILEMCLLMWAVIHPVFIHHSSPYQNLWLTFLAFTMIFQMYSVPVFLLGGLPSSMLIDSLTFRMKSTSWTLQYFIRFILYAIASILVMTLFFRMMQSGTITYSVKPTLTEDITLAMSYALPGLVFYHTSLLLKWVKVRRRRTLGLKWSDTK